MAASDNDGYREERPRIGKRGRRNKKSGVSVCFSMEDFGVSPPPRAFASIERYEPGDE